MYQRKTSLRRKAKDKPPGQRAHVGEERGKPLPRRPWCHPNYTCVSGAAQCTGLWRISHSLSTSHFGRPSGSSVTIFFLSTFFFLATEILIASFNSVSRTRMGGPSTLIGVSSLAIGDWQGSKRPEGLSLAHHRQQDRNNSK